ncbi:hypothetical protein ABIE33_006966 [Ensifer sp. 4252]
MSHDRSLAQSPAFQLARDLMVPLSDTAHDRVKQASPNSVCEISKA